ALLNTANDAVRRLLQAQLVDQLLEAFTVFSQVDRIRRSTNYRHTGGFQTCSQVQRSLATELHNHTYRFLYSNNFQHVFQCYRLKVQTVGNVVVSGYSFRVAVDHDGFITIFTHCQRCMYAAVVKLDTLADTVRTTAQNHDLL